MQMQFFQVNEKLLKKGPVGKAAKMKVEKLFFLWVQILSTVAITLNCKATKILGCDDHLLKKNMQMELMLLKLNLLIGRHRKKGLLCICHLLFGLN
jgi:hypothetical protein